MKKKIPGTIGYYLNENNLITTIIKQANEIYLSYFILINHNFTKVAIYNGAFACELYLKAILYSHVNKRITDHSLSNLFNSIKEFDEDAYMFIENYFCENQMFDFLNDINKISLWFNNFRYAYEFKTYIGINIKPLELLISSLNKYCNTYLVRSVG